MTTVGLPDTPPTRQLNSRRATSRQPPERTDQKVDWQQGGSRQINTRGHSTPLTITSAQLNGTGRPVLVHRISVRDEEAIQPHGRHVGQGSGESVAQRLSTSRNPLWRGGCMPAVSPRAPSQPHSGSAVRLSIARSQSSQNGPTESATDPCKFFSASALQPRP